MSEVLFDLRPVPHLAHLNPTLRAIVRLSPGERIPSLVHA